jgi:hypothetical protein
MGASRLIRPASTSLATSTASSPLLQENITAGVTLFHGRLQAGSADPPHRSTTGCPPTISASAAPPRGLAATAATKASATGSNPSVTVPSTLLP